jgi:hypothetical protein
VAAEKEHIRLEYSQRVQLLALFKQVKLGSYSVDKDTETGYFDVVGSDRRYFLQSCVLGGCDIVDMLCCQQEGMERTGRDAQGGGTV